MHITTKLEILDPNCNDVMDGSFIALVLRLNSY
jgi:hypothetical protein